MRQPRVQGSLDSLSWARPGGSLVLLFTMATERADNLDLVEPVLTQANAPAGQALFGDLLGHICSEHDGPGVSTPNLGAWSLTGPGHDSSLRSPAALVRVNEPLIRRVRVWPYR